MDIKNIVGLNLKKIRLKNKFSRNDLARQLGKTPACIANIESGTRAPSLPLLFSLAKILQEDVTVFFDGNATTVTDWNENWHEVGKNIVRHRKSKKIRQYICAKEAGITVAFLCNIEKGKCICSLPVLVALAKTIGVDICDLFVLQ